MIVAGFGMRNGTNATSLRDALRGAAGAHTVQALATLESKAAMLAPLADVLNLPLITLSPDALQRVATPTQSAASLAAHGSGSVAEAAALIAAGPGASLWSPRHVSGDGMATCAIAVGGLA
ncbi:precorrin methylase [Actibacterium mucosum KCTC 23349]|uniref:Precorrin methylase n=2 Tax=Actibacterium TaxID=1433986 RepID=A0A037ZHR9_9RHOB|nr:precorrin methylase [Actibacterium mucosum KCTC 23349]